jgi:hypothetical protein
MVAIRDRMVHFVEEGFLHGATASVVGKKPDKGLATHEIDEPVASQTGGTHGGYPHRSVSQSRMHDRAKTARYVDAIRAGIIQRGLALVSKNGRPRRTARGNIC